MADTYDTFVFGKKLCVPRHTAHNMTNEELANTFRHSSNPIIRLLCLRLENECAGAEPCAYAPAHGEDDTEQAHNEQRISGRQFGEKNHVR